MGYAGGLNMRKIVVLDGYTENPGDLSWDVLKAYGELAIYDRTPEHLTAERMKDAEIVLTNKTGISGKDMEENPALKFISVLATGYNVVDLAAARKRGITVSNVPAYGTESVAQFTMALLLELCHHVGAHSDSVHQGRWTSCQDFCYWEYPLVELSGKTLGIIGFGRIGRSVARMASAFGMRVLVCAAHEIPEHDLSEQIQSAELEKIYRESDVLTLNCPLTAENQGMICRETIRQMKTGAFLINTARGGLLQEADVAEALREGKLGGAALDVVSKEPIERENPLLQAPNTILTPHIAWAPKEARQRLMEVTAENIRAFLEGKPVHVV